MKFFNAAAAALLSATALAAPTGSADKETTTYQIKDFTTRKYDGVTTNTLSFRILATNGGALDFECIPYDPAIKGATNSFENGRVYYCGENTFFSFSYTEGDDTNELFLWQEVTQSDTLGGKTTFGNPICRAGGSSTTDMICEVPAFVDLTVTLEKLGA